MIVRPDHPSLRWEGAVDVEHTHGWSRAWRLPLADIDLFDDMLQSRAAMSAGVRISFVTDSTEVTGRMAIAEALDEIAQIDVVVDGERIMTVPIRDHAFTSGRLPTGEKEIELWLPQFGDFRLVELTLDVGAALRPAPVDERLRLITYGSSITHCRAAASPTRTWPALVARDLGLHLTCFGFAGQAHLDPGVARMIHGLRADVITACLGINVYGAGTFTARSFRPAVIGFLETIREGHAETPIVVISPIFSPPREQVRNAAGLTLEDVRSEVGAAVDLLRARGDRQLHLLNGLDVLGVDDGALLADNLHPDAEGYALMARRMTPIVAEHLRSTNVLRSRASLPT